MTHSNISQYLGLSHKSHGGAYGWPRSQHEISARECYNLVCLCVPICSTELLEFGGRRWLHSSISLLTVRAYRYLSFFFSRRWVWPIHWHTDYKYIVQFWVWMLFSYILKTPVRLQINCSIIPVTGCHLACHCRPPTPRYPGVDPPNRNVSN